MQRPTKFLLSAAAAHLAPQATSSSKTASHPPALTYRDILASTFNTTPTDTSICQQSQQPHPLHRMRRLRDESTCTKYYHESDIPIATEVRRLLRTLPYGVEGGCHVDMYGKAYPPALQRVMDTHGYNSGMFDRSANVEHGKWTHVWLSQQDMALLGMKPKMNATPLMRKNEKQ